MRWNRYAVICKFGAEGSSGPKKTGFCDAGRYATGFNRGPPTYHGPRGRDRVSWISGEAGTPDPATGSRNRKDTAMEWTRRDQGELLQCYRDFHQHVLEEAQILFDQCSPDYLCLKRQFQHWLKYCFKFEMQSTTPPTMRCSMHSPQNYSTRKAAVCLHSFIPICADATRPNGWLIWNCITLKQIQAEIQRSLSWILCRKSSMRRSARLYCLMKM